MRKPSQPLLKRFFAGLTEQTFQAQLGVVDPPLVDYLTDLLARFVRSDSIYRVRDPNGRRLRQVVEMLLEAEQREGSAKREVHRHIGDFTLFWCGVFPEALGRLPATSADRFLDYREQGKRAYLIASRLDPPTEEEDEAPADLLERLSALYELCAEGLRKVRREWERREAGPAAGLLM